MSIATELLINTVCMVYLATIYFKVKEYFNEHRSDGC